MSNDKVLTGIIENGTGFVGKRNLKFGHTQGGKSRITFDLACGKGEVSENKYPTWRHCIAYGRLADSLQHVRPGQLVKFTGWVSTEAKQDEYYKPVLDQAGGPVLYESLILKTADLLKHTKLQPELLPDVECVHV